MRRGACLSLFELLCVVFLNRIVLLLGEELDRNNNPDVRKEISAIRAALNGDKEHNVRANVGAVCATTREQVRCLIDLASDLNVQARCWIGLAPWL